MASYKKQVILYQVIKGPMRYEVYEVTRYISYETDGVTAVEVPGLMYRMVWWALRLKTAEAAAKGMAEATWTEQGPILAQFATYLPTEPISFKEQ